MRIQTGLGFLTLLATLLLTSCAAPTTATPVAAINPAPPVRPTLAYASADW